MKRAWLLWLPFGLGILLLAGLFLGLRKPENHVIASKMVGQPLPEFATGPALPGQAGAATADFADGKPRLLNIFASWCVPCREEIPMLMRLKAMGAEVNGLAVHDTSEDLARFLGETGNPYHRLGLDDAGRAQLAFGASGVPETFVVDGHGKILHQHIGVVTEADVPVLMTMLAQAQKEPQ